MIPLYNTFAVLKPPAGSSEPVRALGLLDPSVDATQIRVGPHGSADSTCYA